MPQHLSVRRKEKAVTLKQAPPLGVKGKSLLQELQNVLLSRV
jgi:hypothetical protein